MAELERELRALGDWLELPRTPDLAPVVRARIEAAPPRRTLLPRRALVLALAVVAVAVGATMAVPQARTALLEWLGLRGVTIERAETRPTATQELDDRAALDLGERVSLAQARAAVGYRVGLPTDARLGAPDEVYLASGGRISLLYLDDDGRIEALVTQFRAQLDGDFVHKAIGPGTSVEPASVGRFRGWWVEGEPHEVVLVRDGEPIFETLRLAANTLLWERGDVTLRVEGDFSKEEAVRIARSAG